MDPFVDAWQHRDIPKLAALLSQIMVLDVTDNQISSIVGFEVPGGQCKARSMVTRT
ncbi:hypothetical protein ACWCOV_20220 [Kribbella sp. NPDC002412]